MGWRIVRKGEQGKTGGDGQEQNRWEGVEEKARRQGQGCKREGTGGRRQ